MEAAKGSGIDLNGREAQFVDNTCKAAPPDIMALRIGEQAKAAASGQRRIP